LAAYALEEANFHRIVSFLTNMTDAGFMDILQALGPALVAGVVIHATSAQAQFAEVICDESERLASRIYGMNGAEMRGQGVRSSASLIEVWIAPDTGDWTLVQTYPNGTSCIMAAGEHWQSFEPVKDPA
jgi:hypothetical protein